MQFRVVWVGRPGTPEAGQIGIYSLEPGKSIWGVVLPAPGLDDYQPPRPKQPTMEVDIPKAATDSWVGSERRKHPRYECMGQAKILPKGSELWLGGVLRDISLGGCYVEMMSPLSPQTQVELSLTVEELVVHTSGVVKVSFQGMGMGVAFTEIASQDQELLERIVGRAAGAQSKTEPVSEPAPRVASKTPKETDLAPTPIPTISDTEAALETLLKLLARKAVLTREEFVELMKKLKSLDR